MRRIRTNMFARLWRRIKGIPWIKGIRWIRRSFKLLLFHILLLFRKKAIYKKFLIAIDYLLNYAFYPFYITIIKANENEFYAEGSRWGPDVEWDRTSGGMTSALNRLYEEDLTPGPHIIVMDLFLTFKDYNNLIKKLKEELKIKMTIYDQYDHLGLDLMTWKPDDRGRYKMTIALSDALKYRFKKRISIFYNKIGKNRELDPNLIHKVLLKLKRDGLLYSYNIMKDSQTSGRKEFSKYNLTARGKAFTTDTSNITNLSDEMLKQALSALKIVEALK